MNRFIYCVLLMSMAMALNACSAKKVAQNTTIKMVYHQVQAGETVSKIAERYGVDWRILSAYNNLDSRHTVKVGQWLAIGQLSPPAIDQTSIMPAAAPPIADLSNNASLAVRKIFTNPISITLSATQETTNTTINEPFASPVANQHNLVVRSFGSPINSGYTEGVFFSGKAGDPIHSVGSGRVIAIENAFRSLVVIAHDNGYVSHYYDVGDIAVKQGQYIKAGHKIGIMLAQTKSGVALFELRLQNNQGEYVNPSDYLK